MAASLPSSRDTALLQQIERVANIGGWELDPQTRELLWSAQMYRIRELDPAQFRPNLDNALDFYPPESRARLAAAVQSAISDGTAWDIELDLITAAGKRRRVRSIGASEIREGRCIRITGTVQDVTERHEAREALRRAEEEQRRLATSLQIAADAAEIGSVVRDMRTGEAVWDARTFRIYGFPLADRPPSRAELLTHIHPEDRAGFERDWNSAFSAASGRYDSEFRAVHPDGRVVYVYARGQFDRDEDGNALRFVGVVIDVTRRRLTEKQAREADEWLRFASEAIDIGMFEYDGGSRASSWNEAMRRLHGLAPDEPVPSREEWRERFVHPDDRDLQHRHAQKLADGNSPYELEYRIRRKDGAQRWLYTRAISVPGSGDGRRVLGLTIDITERKRSEARLQLATASTGVGIYERDVETGAAYWDPQMFRLFGLPPATTPPKFEELQQWIHPDDRTRFWQRREELLRAG
ncbi:MAG: PAS domain-containing protein, partial [Gemmatimonadota bacterium]